MSTYYLSKGPSLMPSTGPNIWTTQPPSNKPINLQSFNPPDIITYVPYFNTSKYTTVVKIIVSLAEAL